ncbi:MAG: histidinol-phosphate transaminase [Selenomonadaceae bacterium]|nr:histidinol-phosphate transaminase [Selenomonadaceae bacterium]MBR1859734.1 histidinol-phosphate transaminase [Selenomonadaceae bacterium]
MPSYDGVERDYRIKVNANECNLNLPPLVEERVLSRLSRIAFNRYPNYEYDALREQIARNFSVDKEQILIGGGSSEIIEKLFYAFGGSDSHKIVYPQPSFSMYKIYAKAAEAQPVPFDLDDKYDIDVDKFIAAVNDNEAALAVVCNPNNPTGNVLSIDEIEEIAKNVKCAFLVDEAYVEFYGKSSVNLIKKYPNLIVARTFSKAYGLAGARVGYMIARSEVTDMIAKTYMPYHMNTLSLATADIVYQMRDEFVPRIQMMIAERKRISEQLQKLNGVKVYPSSTNFVLMKYDKAVALNEHLESLNIGVRSFGAAPRLENCLRISMGTRAENDECFNVIKNFVQP